MFSITDAVQTYLGGGEVLPSPVLLQGIVSDVVG